MNTKFHGKFEKALEYALQKHKGQYRKSSNIPYYWHPISVAKNVEENKLSRNLELLMTASLLHDTVEDCEGVTLEEIARIFGYQVAALVDELSSDKEHVRLQGKTEYLKHKLENISSYGLVIKLSDRLDNIKDLHKMDQTFQKKYQKETVEILSHLENCGRKLSKTHVKLIGKIKFELFNHGKSNRLLFGVDLGKLISLSMIGYGTNLSQPMKWLKKYRNKHNTN